MQIKKTKSGYQVKSDSGNTYSVVRSGDRFVCDCSGFKFRQRCKHTEAAEYIEQKASGGAIKEKPSKKLIPEEPCDGRTDPVYPYVAHYGVSIRRTLEFIFRPKKKEKSQPKTKIKGEDKCRKRSQPKK